MFELIPRKGKNELGMRGFDDFDNPWSMMERLLESPFESMFSNYHPIKVDVREKDNEYVLEAELPGISKDNISIEAHDNNLTITVAENKIINEEKSNYIRRERKEGSFSRSIYLDNLNEDNIKAKYENGLLTILAGKEKIEKPKTKKVSID